MLQITIDSLKEYQTCSLYYSLNRNKTEPKVISQAQLIEDKYENTLHKVINFFFYKKQGGQIPSYNAILNRWEKLWFPKNMTSYDLAIEQHSVSKGNLASLTTQAATSLMDFHQIFAQDTGLVYLLDENYFVQINSAARMTGSIDLVLRDVDKLRLFKLHTSNKRFNPSSYVMDFAGASLALASKMQKRLPVEFYVYNTASQHPGLHPIKVQKRDLDTLKYWVQQVAQDEVFIPRRGLTTLCKGCAFDRQCRDWEFPDG